MTYTIENIRPYIIFEAIMGSKAYGTDTPESDTDIRGVFIQPYEDIVKYGFIEQVSDETNDIVYYELKRFLELAAKNNPNILELLFVKDTVLYKNPIWDILTKDWKLFISKECKSSFGGYAIAQIKKAKGYNKMMNWEQDRVKRKSVLDFCFVLDDKGRTLKFHKWLEIFNTKYKTNYTQKDFGLSKVNNARDIYGIFDITSQPEYKQKKEWYGGIINSEDNSNDVKLSSFDKNAPFIAYLVFNKDSWSSHCKDYSNYQTWLKKRNVNRYKMNKAHGKNYDSKNFMHVFRLLNMAKEIAWGDPIKVKRDDDEIETLMKIRRGEMEYDDLIRMATELHEEVDRLFDQSDLPRKTNREQIAELELEIRNKF